MSWARAGPWLGSSGSSSSRRASSRASGGVGGIALVDEHVGRLPCRGAGRCRSRLELGVHRESASITRLSADIDARRRDRRRASSVAGQRPAARAAPRASRPRPARTRRVVEPEPAVHRPAHLVDPRAGQRLDPAELVGSEEVPRRAQGVGPDDPAVVHRGPDVVDRRRRRAASAGRSPHSAPGTSCDWTAPNQPTTASGVGERRADEPAVAEPGVGDRAVRHKGQCRKRRWPQASCSGRHRVASASSAVLRWILAEMSEDDAPAARGPAISAAGLTKRFGDRVAFEDVSFEIGYGEVFGFLGPNGAGKTTTVRTLGTLIAPTSGSATVAGIPLTPRERRGDPPADLDHARVAGPLPAPERDREPRVLRRPLRGARPERSHRRAPCGPSTWPTGPTMPAAPCPRACASGSPWRGRCSATRRCCSSTSRPPASTRSPPATSTS